MKTCGYCNNEYDEKEVKCPVCGSRLLKHTKGAELAADEYRRIEEEIKKKRISRSMMLGIGAGVIVLIVLITIISVVNYFSDPQRDIDKEAKKLYEVAIQQIKEGDFDGAIHTLDEINVSWSDYNKVEGKKVEAVEGQLSNTIAQYETVGDYESIITYINDNVGDISSNTEIMEIYDDSVVKYKEDVIDKVDEYVNNGDYSAAISVLTTAIRICGTDAKIENKLVDIQKQEVLAKVMEYESLNSYADAISYINEKINNIGNDSEIIMKLSECENLFRDQVILNAQEVFEENGYEAAINEINYGLSVLVADNQLINEKQSYEKMIPIKLSDISSYYGELWFEEDISDNMGNRYSNSFIAHSVERSAIYDIGMQYNVLKATIAVTKQNQDYDVDVNKTGYIKIYGDNRLLWEDVSLQCVSKPYSIELDITNVTDLKIVMKGISLNLGWDSMDVIIADASLQKTEK